jgi:hypothetical protein
VQTLARGSRFSQATPSRAFAFSRSRKETTPVGTIAGFEIAHEEYPRAGRALGVVNLGSPLKSSFRHQEGIASATARMHPAVCDRMDEAWLLLRCGGSRLEFQLSGLPGFLSAGIALPPFRQRLIATPDGPRPRLGRVAAAFDGNMHLSRCTIRARRGGTVSIHNENKAD